MDIKIKKVIHIADIHIRNLKRHKEYKIQLDKFLKEARDVASEFDFEEVRILIAGDVFHQKIQVSNEQSNLLTYLLRELNEIAPTIIIAGNHDFLESNIERLDSITPIINMLNLGNIYYLDMLLDYKSGIWVNGDIAWVLYSIFDNYRKPDIEEFKIDNPNKKIIGLFHGPIVGSSTDHGFEIEHGISTDDFKGCDVVMCGDIHKRQELYYGDTLIVYPGSLIQQHKGESVSGHGYLVWDIPEMTYDEYDISNDYGFYVFNINSIADLENGLEEFANF